MESVVTYYSSEEKIFSRNSEAFSSEFRENLVFSLLHTYWSLYQVQIFNDTIVCYPLQQGYAYYIESETNNVHIPETIYKFYKFFWKWQKICKCLIYTGNYYANVYTGICL